MTTFLSDHCSRLNTLAFKKQRLSLLLILLFCTVKVRAQTPSGPVFTSTQVTKAKATVPYSYKAAAISGSPITYSAVILPTWLSLAPTDGEDVKYPGRIRDSRFCLQRNRNNRSA